jgi:hypothetical protein
MPNKPGKPGPRKKLGERYPSGDLKPVIAPAFWERIRRSGDKQASSELVRLFFSRELTETQLTRASSSRMFSVAVTRKIRPRSARIPIRLPRGETRTPLRKIARRSTPSCRNIRPR